MKKPFDYLLTDKTPFYQVSQAYVMVSKGNLLAVRSDGKTESIPVANVSVLILGAGCSITSDAARMCAKHDCYVTFSRGGLNIHSVWHSGRYAEPQRIMKQALLFSDERKKLKVAKFLVSERMKREGANNGDILRLNSFHSTREVLSYEALWAKRIFSELRNEFSVSFTRNKESIVGSNGKISLLNNLLYNYTTSVILSLGLSPSMGFVHGTTRRGGLTFDIADVFKYELSLRPAFEKPNEDGQKSMHSLSRKIRNKRSAVTKDMISLIQNILEIE